MFKDKVFKGGAGLPISVDSRGGSLGGAPAYTDANAADDYLTRDSIMDAQDARDSIFGKKNDKKRSWIPKKVRFNMYLRRKNFPRRQTRSPAATSSSSPSSFFLIFSIN
jgi:hypothetical protein